MNRNMLLALSAFLVGIVFSTHLVMKRKRSRCEVASKDEGSAGQTKEKKEKKGKKGKKEKGKKKK